MRVCVIFALPLTAQRLPHHGLQPGQDSRETPIFLSLVGNQGFPHDVNLEVAIPKGYLLQWRNAWKHWVWLAVRLRDVAPTI